MITHYRIDSRLVHGQTTTVLQKTYACNGILVVDDELAKDEVMSNIYRSAVPPSVKVYIYDIEKVLRQLPKAEASDKCYYVIFKSPLEVTKLIALGYRFKGDIVMGPQHNAQPGANAYIFGIYLTDEEAAAVDQIEASGINVILNPFQNPSGTPWREAKQKRV